MGMREAMRRWTRDEATKRAVSALFARIQPYVARHHLGDVPTAPADLDFRRGFGSARSVRRAADQRKEAARLA